MAKRADRPVRVEYWGVLLGDEKSGYTQVLECRITTPKRSLVNGFRIGELPPLEEGEAKRTRAVETFARAQLMIAQRKATGSLVVDTSRAHMSQARTLEAVLRLAAEIDEQADVAEPVKEAPVKAELEPVKEAVPEKAKAR